MSESPLNKLKRLVGESEKIRHGNLKSRVLKKKIGKRKEAPIEKEMTEAEEREDRGRMNSSQREY